MYSCYTAYECRYKILLHHVKCNARDVCRYAEKRRHFFANDANGDTVCEFGDIVGAAQSTKRVEY